MKLCGKCKTLKLESAFGKCNSKYDGLQSACLECRKLYRDAHKLESMQYKEVYKQLYPDRIKLSNAKHYNKNREVIKQRVRVYAKANKAKILSRNITYLKANPEKAKQLSRKKYLAFVLKPLVLERDNFSCRLCMSKVNLQIHHIIPKKLEESVDTLSNLITLCKTCHKDKAHNGCSRDLNLDIQVQLSNLVSESL